MSLTFRLLAWTAILVRNEGKDGGWAIHMHSSTYAILQGSTSPTCDSHGWPSDSLCWEAILSHSHGGHGGLQDVQGYIKVRMSLNEVAHSYCLQFTCVTEMTIITLTSNSSQAWKQARWVSHPHAFQQICNPPGECISYFLQPRLAKWKCLLRSRTKP